MARTRLIKPGFFSNDLLAECDPLARLLFAGLWTIVDRDGRIVDRRARIKAQVLPYDDCDIDALMGQLIGRGFVQWYAVDGVCYLQVTGFAKHQRPHKKETSENLPEPSASNGVVSSRGNSATSTGLSETSRGDSGSSQPLTLNPSPFSLDPSPLTLNPSQPSVVSSAPRKARAKPTDPIVWTSESSWAGITDADRAAWAIAYPAVDIDRDLVKADQYLRSNPAKAHKRKWRSFITRWFDRTQERGGNRTDLKPAQANGVAHGHHRHGPHIPPDCHPDDFQFFWDGNFPNVPTLYKRLDGKICHCDTRKPLED